MGVSRITDLRRWHWVAVALALGALHGSVWQSATPGLADGLDDFEAVITEQAEFERALVSEVRGVRRFKDLTVHPRRFRTPDGGRRLVHLVTGTYWDGRRVQQDGQEVARWVPACYVAPAPYVPVGAGGAAPTSFETVRGYLESIGGRGVRFRYAWWWWATTPVFVSVCVSLVVVGGVWPTVINLLTFGTFGRPADAPGVSLWRVKRGAAPAPAPVTVARPADRSEAEADAGPAGAGCHVPQAGPAPAPRPLALEPVAAAPAPQQDGRHFGASRNDFYPTELHAESDEAK